MSRIDLTGIPGFRADGPAANDWRTTQQLPVLKVAAAFLMMVAAVALACFGLLMAVAG